MCYTLRVRAQRAKQVRALRKKGFIYDQIAEKLGISKGYVNELIYDPDGSKSKARKDSYRGTCRTCGARTTGSNGKNAPIYCNKHASRAYFLVWSDSKIIAAIREWHFLHGRTPVSTDWNRRVEGSPGQYVGGPRLKWTGKRRWPPLRAVQRSFGSWSNAIEAAGFPRPKIGHYRDESQRGIVTKWPAEAVLEWIRSNAKNGKPPASKGSAPVHAAVREFGSWNNAVIAAGYRPNRIVRSTS